MELHQLISFDQHLFLALNGVHGAYADRFMWLYTQTWTWIPSLLVMLAVIIRTKKKESIWILLAMVLAIVFADQVSSGLIKPIAERFRPSHEPALDGLVHLVNGYHGGYYGFVSSHAANSFAIALFTSLLFRNRRYTIILFLWALVNCYSRIYLGVHYPGDILGGMVVGITGGYLFFILLRCLRPRALYVSSQSTYIDRHAHGFLPHDSEVCMWVVMLTIIVLAFISLFQ
jgi:undecaprenyl-diphosphatase